MCLQAKERQRLPATAGNQGDTRKESSPEPSNGTGPYLHLAFFSTGQIFKNLSDKPQSQLLQLPSALWPHIRLDIWQGILSRYSFNLEVIQRMLPAPCPDSFSLLYSPHFPTSFSWEHSPIPHLHTSLCISISGSSGELF